MIKTRDILYKLEEHNDEHELYTGIITPLRGSIIPSSVSRFYNRERTINTSPIFNSSNSFIQQFQQPSFIYNQGIYSQYNRSNLFK